MGLAGQRGALVMGALRKPSAHVGDVVFAEGYWYLLTEKAGQRCRGRLLGGKANGEYRFMSRSIERVFRELGRGRSS